MQFLYDISGKKLDHQESDLKFGLGIQAKNVKILKQPC